MEAGCSVSLSTRSQVAKRTLNGADIRSSQTERVIASGLASSVGGAVEFKVLGPLEVRRDDAVLLLGGPGQRALLATLILCANEVVSTDRLFDLLWEDEPPDTARHILHINVSRLRKVLEDDASNPTLLLTRPPGYLLHTPDETVDAVRFEALVETGRGLVHEDPARASATLSQALALWRGETLADLPLDPFTLPGVARLEELRVSATEDRIDAELALGHHAEVVGDLRRLSSDYPLRERVTQQLMLALYRSGRQAEALSAFETARSRLVSDLGIDPGSALQALERAVLQHDPLLDLAVDPSRKTSAMAPVIGDSISSFHEVRRVVSIVVSEVTVRSNLGETLDPEPHRRIMQSCLEATRASTQRHGGTFGKLAGDTFVAVFGVPRLHEDDALRAVRAASDMREALATLKDHLDRDNGQTLTCRIGVNTGEVVTGSEDQAITTGEAVNAATRLAHGAAPGQIVLGDDTFVLVRDAVLAERIDPSSVQGSAHPTSAYRLIDVASGVAGFARHLDAPIVGRERELSLLQSAFDRTVSDQACQLFTVLGAAGVGKSRLLAAFVEELGDRATVLRGRCLPYGEGITFYPLAEALIDVADLNECDTPMVSRAKLAALAQRGEDADRIAERVGQAIGIAGSETAPGETFWAIRVLLERLAAERPVVFMIDDLQWAEPTFLELVEHVADLAQDAPILLACMARTELLDDHSGWAGGKLNATSILLEALDIAECGTLVANLLADDAVDEGIRTLIAKTAEGNPLCAEEITGLLVDDGSLVLKDGRWAAVSDLSEVPIPLTILALLAARLDKLPPEERRLIEVGSVMGQVFYPGAVRELVGGGSEDLDLGIASLIRKQFVRPERSDLPGTEVLAFRHLLIRDAAYDAIPKATRAELHERFADWLDKTAETVGERGEILGYHLEQSYRYRTELDPIDDRTGTLGCRAGEYLGDAGLQAFARGDMSASTGLLERAVRLLPSGHPQIAFLEGRLVYAHLRSGDIERAAGASERHLQCARERGDRAQEQRAELGALDVRRVLSPEDWTIDEARRVADQAIGIFEELHDEGGLSKAHFCLAECASDGGKATEALSEAELGLTYALRSEERILLSFATTLIGGTLIVGATPVGAALGRVERLVDQMAADRVAEARANEWVALFLAHLGRFEEAKGNVQEVLRVFGDLGNTREIAWGGYFLGLVEWLAGDALKAEDELRRVCDLFRHIEDNRNLPYCAEALADVLLSLGGRDDEVLELADEVRSLMADDIELEARWRAVRSVALARLGHVGQAMPLIEESERLARATDFVSLLADTKLWKAEVLKIADRREDAVVAAREALALYQAKEFVPHIGWARAMLDSLSV
jgi:DNA-binding SARP family transcriptional activator/tetratricopeptide (TPR) repeat protein